MSFSVILAVDPGTQAGWALTDSDGLLVRIGTVVTPDWFARTQEILEVVRRASAVFAVNGQRLLVVEEQFFGRNPKTLIGLVERRMEWEVIVRTKMKIHGWNIARVNPKKWQKALLYPKKKCVLKREEVKQRAREEAKVVFCADDSGLVQDEIDAMCIAKWAQMQIGLGLI